MKSFLRNNGLSLALFGLFLLSMVGQGVSGMFKYNSDQKEHGKTTVTLGEYLAGDAFLEATAENWESEFLSLFAMVFFSVWLREKDSPESKPVNAPHDKSGK